jgi:beta-glucanase (GH16 family)
MVNISSLAKTIFRMVFFVFAINHSVVQAQSSWRLVWSDEFNGTQGSGVNPTKWLYDKGKSYCKGCPKNWGTGEIEIMTDSTDNVYQDGAGHLVIKPIKNSNSSWTSGRIETQLTNFQPPKNGAMAVEASIQLPGVSGEEAKGYWPTFWMMGASFRGNYHNSPEAGEIDIMENINGLNTVQGTFHCGTKTEGPCKETRGIGGDFSGLLPSLQNAFHSYRMEFDKSTNPEQLRFYIDNINYFTVFSNQIDAKTWKEATNHGFFIILNVAIGGGWSGKPTDKTKSGQPMLIDYVRVYYRERYKP